MDEAGDPHAAKASLDAEKLPSVR